MEEKNTENTDNNNKAIYGISNALIQCGAILAASYFGIDWPMYFVMGMIVLLGIFQTIAAAGMLSKITETSDVPSNLAEPYQILIGILYMMSGYQLYLMGFEVFSGFAIAHASLYILTFLFKRIKQ